MNSKQKVLLFGTFDVLHPGHEFVIEHALQRGDVFITLALDETIVKIKGAAPLYTYAIRAQALLERFPTVTIIKGDAIDYKASLRLVQPDIVLLGYDQMLPPNVTLADITVPVERLPAYKPEEFKSSLLKQTVQPKKPIHICVFCGSRMGNRAAYTDVAKATGAWIASHAYALVYGGSDAGLMGIVAQTALRMNATVIGIQPAFLQHMETKNMHMTKYIETVSMSTRKDAMIQMSDAFVVLPGGIGTLDELSEVLCLQSIDQLPKPIILVNTLGFFDPLLQALQNNVEAGFMDQSVLDNLLVVADIEEVSGIPISRLS
jgi:uncharacterized protein (TIGR00730 family)